MQNSRILYIDIIKILAIFLVVLVHVSSPVLSGYGKINIEWWWIANVYDSIARISVPLFFMISGYLLLSKNDSIISFYKKRVPKILIPMIFWSVFFVFFAKYIEHKDINVLNALLSAINKSQYNHLWFLYAYLGLLISSPILMSIVQNSSQAVIKLLILLWVINIMIIPDINYYLHLSLSSYLPFGSYIGYFLVGYLLGSQDVNKNTFIISSLLLIFITILMSIGTYYLTVDSGKFNEQLFSYARLPVFLQSIAAFFVFKYIGQLNFFEHSQSLKTLFTIVSGTVFGIYLVHPIFLRLMINGTFGFTQHGVNSYAIYTIPFTALLAFSFSLVLVLVLQRIPYIRHIVPK